MSKKKENQEQEMELILRLINHTREYYNITVQDLTFGLCSTTTLSQAMEEDKKGIDKLLAEALLQRLGRSTRKFEFLLDVSQYHLFELRENIRICLERKDSNTAAEILSIYRKKSRYENILHRQMALLFESYILNQQKAAPEEIYTVTEKALRLTIPKFQLECAGSFFYSEVELLLAFRIAYLKMQLGQQEEAAKGYEELHTLMQQERYADGEQMDVFAPILYHLAKYYYQTGAYEKAYEISREGIEQIPKHNKFLYLCELFDINAHALVRTQFWQNEPAQQEQLVEGTLNYQYHKVFREMFEIYVPDWNADTEYPMYREYNVLSMGKIIKQRRLLHGLTQEQLVQAVPGRQYTSRIQEKVAKNNAICDVDTLSRLENGKCSTQWSIEREILNRLKLPMEKWVCRYITDDFKMYQQIETIEKYVNLRNYEQVMVKIKEIKEKSKAQKQYVTNDQWMEMIGYFAEGAREKKDWQADRERLLNLLDMTFPKEKYADVTCFLFSTERELVRNIASNLAREKRSEEAFALLLKIKEGYENICIRPDILIYTLMGVNRSIESVLANKGEFEQANQIIYSEVNNCFKHNILNGLSILLYDLAWNMHTEKSATEDEICRILRIAYAAGCQREHMAIVKHIAAFCEKNYPDKNILSGLVNLHYYES